MIPYKFKNDEVYYYAESNKQEWIDIITNPNQGKGIWAYAPMLPVETKNIVSMGEGFTPLTKAINLAELCNIKGLYVKNEGMNPTGTFKDRCQSVAITKAIQSDVKGVIIGSAGNAGAAAAAYAAKAKLPCFVFLPAHTPKERLVQTLQYGAKVIKIEGSVNDCIDTIAFVKDEFKLENVSTANCMNPYQGSGCKTISYEIAYQIGFKAPDWIICPIGGGGLLSGISCGFKEMYNLGIIDKIPRMVGIQADGCAAVATAFRKNLPPDGIVRFDGYQTLAVSIADPYPLDGEFALKAIYDTNGYSDSVSDKEILKAQKELSEQEGVFGEPASSVTIAALHKLLGQGIINQQETVVCIISGNGLKDLSAAGQLLQDVPVIKKDKKQVVETMAKYFNHDL